MFAGKLRFGRQIPAESASSVAPPTERRPGKLLHFGRQIPAESRVAITPSPTPAPPAPTITPETIAATLINLQTQISRLTGEVVALRAQLQESASDKARLTQQLADTQTQLITLTDSFRLLLTKP